MRILFLHKFNLNKGWGGSASYLQALVKSLIARGHTVRVASGKCPDKYGLSTSQFPFRLRLTFGPEKRPGETTIDELSTATLESLAAEAAQAVATEEFHTPRPDLIIANHINLMALVAQQLSRRFNVPYRIISFGTDTRLLLRDARYRRLFGPAAQAAEKILAISGYVAAEVRSAVGGRVAVLGGGVDPELFYLPSESRTPGGRMLYFGRLVTEKGIWVLLEAIRMMKNTPDLELVGEGPLSAELASFLADSPQPGRVTLTHYVEPRSLRRVILGAGLVVVPSTWQEPLGLVVLEAMACGRPVVASSVGGIPEMITDGLNGLLVPPGDPAALAAALDRVLDEPAFHRHLTDGARKTAIKSYHDLAHALIA